jgi:hypothetical protein
MAARLACLTVGTGRVWWAGFPSIGHDVTAAAACSAVLQTKRQLEEDADREIEELKETYEQRLAAEREVRALLFVAERCTTLQQQSAPAITPFPCCVGVERCKSCAYFSFMLLLPLEGQGVSYSVCAPTMSST